MNENQINGGGMRVLIVEDDTLVGMGLLRQSSEMYALPRGYYGLSSILLLLALMAWRG